MPTVVTKTIKASGGDYTSLTAAIAGTAANLVSLDRQLNLECYKTATGDQNISAEIIVSGYTTDATRYVKIYAPSTERHTGVWNVGTFYYTSFNNTANQGIKLSTPYTVLDGIASLSATTSTASANIEINADYCTISNCLIVMGGSFGSAYGVHVVGSSSNSSTSKCINVIAYGGAPCFYGSATAQMACYNCFAWNTYNNGTSGLYVGTTPTNCIAYGSIGGSQAFTYCGSGGDYNSTSAATSGAGGAHDLTNQTFYFYDPTNRNFQLSSADIGARGLGTDLSGTFTTDIAGNTRSTPWDIGPFKMVQGAASTTTKTVKGSGGDYTSLAAAIAGTAGSLILSNTVLNIQCYASATADNAISASIQVSGYTTDPNHYVKIYTPSTERHPGWWNGSFYFVGAATAKANGLIWIPSTNFLTVEGIAFQPPANTHGLVSGGSSNTINACLFKASTGAYACIYPSGTTTVTNCIMYGNFTSTYGIYGPNTTSVKVYNTVCVHNAGGNANFYGIRGCVFVNCIVANFLGSGFYLSQTGSDYNASTYTSASGGTHDRVSQTFGWTDSSNNRYQLSYGDTGAKGYGTDLSSVFTTDIIGNTRSAPWDIGAWTQDTPSTLTKTVKGSGGDYTSLGAAIAGTAQNLVLNNYQLTISCYASAVADLNGPNVSVTGYTTDAAHRLTISTPSTERHPGYFAPGQYYPGGSGGSYYMIYGAGDFGWSIKVQVPYTTLDGIAFKNDDVANSNVWMASNHSIVSNCISYSPQTYAFNIADSSALVYNCWGYGTVGFGTGGQAGAIFYNCTAEANSQYCFYGAGIFTNCLAKTISGIVAFQGPGSGSDYNASDNGSASGGAHDRVSQTFTLDSTQTYRPRSTDTGAKGYASDLSGLGISGLLVDVGGNTRTAPWDIGAWVVMLSTGVPNSMILLGCGT